MARPFFVFGTRHGTIFNITLTLLSKYKIDAVSLYVGDFYQNKQTFQNLPQNMDIKKFLGLPKNVKTYLTFYDHLRNYHPKLSNKTGHMKIQTDSGIAELDLKKYNEMVNIMNPDYTVGFIDYNLTHKDKSNATKSINRILDILQHKNQMRNTKLLMPLPILQDLDSTFAYLEAILMHEQIKGIVIFNLFQKKGPSQINTIFLQIKRKVLSTNKPQFEISIAGIGKISDIEPQLKSNASMFQINYPFMMAAQNKALIKTNNSYIQKTPQLKDQLDPLSPDCQCYSCTRHSEAYIAHLIKCKQPNATILLSLHNLQIYIDLINSAK